MLRIALAEDDEADRNRIKSYAERFAAEQQLQIQLDTFPSGLGLVTPYKPIYDVIFLDIQMPGLNGMETAQAIRESDDDVLLLFITNLTQYAIKGYSVGALNYLVKPVTYFAFCEEMKNILKKLARKTKKYYYFQAQEGSFRIGYQEILFAEILDRHCYLHTIRGVFTLRKTLDAMEQELSDARFFRCYNSFLINLYSIDRKTGDTIWISSSPIPLSRGKKKEFEARYLSLMGGEL